MILKRKLSLYGSENYRLIINSTNYIMYIVLWYSLILAIVDHVVRLPT